MSGSHLLQCLGLRPVAAASLQPTSRGGWSIVACASLVAALACGGRAESLEGEDSAENRPAPNGAVGPRPTVPEVSGGTAAPAPGPMQPSSPGTSTTMPMPAMPPTPEPPPTEPPPSEPTVPDPPDPVDPPDPPEPVTFSCAEASALQMQAFEQSAIDLLAGCEALYGLRVFGALDLRPLASLRRVGQGGVELGNIASLEGLEGLEETSWLNLSGEALQSLRPLAGLRRLDSLAIAYTGLVDLSGIENVSGIRSLYAQYNRVLENLQGLAAEPEMTEVILQENAVLYDITSLGGVEGLDMLFLMDNPMLAQVPDFERLVRLGVMFLARNFNLQVAPQVPLLTSTNDITVVDHPILERLTGLAALETARSVWISGNPSLVELDLSHLRQAETLVIYDNLRLDGAALASSLAGVESQSHRVAPDQTRASLNPCPWTTDDVCDALCESGTDPVCF